MGYTQQLQNHFKTLIIRPPDNVAANRE